ncbi:MAG: carboxypeptidase regulatory-like domain-containing protein [Clostridia bacterium]|nr:carboxypeptidase regulatory-like domain-containing protein [Clostridia bacterium]
MKRDEKTAIRKITALFLSLLLFFTVFAVHAGSVPSDVICDFTSAAYSFQQAWMRYQDNADELNWSDYSWKAEYTSLNLGGQWQPMVLSVDEYGTKNSFGHSRVFGAQPCAWSEKNGIVLLANQWGDGFWYDMAAVSYTCLQDGNYLLSCPVICPLNDDSLTAGHEGRVTVTKNSEKIWPTNGDYATVSQTVQPVFEDMILTLKEGDIIRFQGFGALCGVAGSANDSYWQNHIFLTPSIQRICSTATYRSDSVLLTKNGNNLLAGELPLSEFYADGNLFDPGIYRWENGENLTDGKADTVAKSTFSLQQEYAYQTLTYELAENSTAEQIQILFEPVQNRFLSGYEIYLSNSLSSLFYLENLVGRYREGNELSRNHLYTLNEPIKVRYVGLKITESRGASASLAEFSVYGYQIGDLDGDHQLAAADTVLLRNSLLMDQQYRICRDLNEDGQINIRDLIQMKKVLIENEYAVNPEIFIPEVPQKMWTQTAVEQPSGAAAPEWMRNAEMFCEASQYDLFKTQADFDKWAPYFEMCIGTWSHNVNDFKKRGVRAGSYFDPYHVYNREELAIIGSDGNGQHSDYASDTGDPLYLVCHNSDRVLSWAKHYAEQCMNFGAVGMFYDDIRMPYEPRRADCQTCYSAQHQHVLSGDISTNYINSTVKELYKTVKQRNKDYYVVLNGGVPTATDQTQEFVMENLWKYCDGCMWENFLYDSNCKRWVTPEMLNQAATRLTNGIREGKVELMLSYSYHKMTAERAVTAAMNTLAFCRLYDLMWSDYASLYHSTVPAETVQKIYGIKTGAAGRLGTYFGTVIDRDSGAPIEGVTVSAGTVSAVTDACGKYRIEMPVNIYQVTLEKTGYQTRTATVSGTAPKMTMQKQSGTVYFVSPDGDNQNDGKTPATAFRSINCAEAKGLLKPGDTVSVGAGTYCLPNQTVYVSSGTAENPITYFADGQVILRVQKGNGTGLIFHGNHIVFDGFTVEGSGSGVGGLLLFEGDGAEVKNCTFRDTAFYTVGSCRKSTAAVTLNGQNAFFHHNIFAQNLYSAAALLLGGAGIRVYNNTFDGAFCTGGRMTTAISANCQTISAEVKNNLFVDFEKLFDGFASVSTGNNLAASVGNTDGFSGQNGDHIVSDFKFMNRLVGDYNLKWASSAVSSGATIGFSYRGELPDIGAKESKFARYGYDAVRLASGCIYRIFADTVVVMNPMPKQLSITVPTARAGVQLKDAVTDRLYQTGTDGKLNLTVPAESSIILQAR